MQVNTQKQIRTCLRPRVVLFWVRYGIDTMGSTRTWAGSPELVVFTIHCRSAKIFPPPSPPLTPALTNVENPSYFEETL